MQSETYTLSNKQITHIEFIKQRQLLLPSLLFLLGNQPLSFISGQVLHLFSPLLNFVYSDQVWTQWANLLSKPQALEHLINALEE